MTIPGVFMLVPFWIAFKECCEELDRSGWWSNYLSLCIFDCLDKFAFVKGEFGLDHSNYDWAQLSTVAYLYGCWFLSLSYVAVIHCLRRWVIFTLIGVLCLLETASVICVIKLNHKGQLFQILVLGMDKGICIRMTLISTITELGDSSGKVQMLQREGCFLRAVGSQSAITLFDAISWNVMK